MTTKIQNSDEITKLIEAQENQLKELLSRVMTNPLQPLKEQAKQLEGRLGKIEGICEATSKQILAMQEAIREQDKLMKNNIKRLRVDILDDLPELLTACLASMPQEVTQLLQNQTEVKDLLSGVQQEQTLHGKLAGNAVLQSEALLLKSLAQMNEISNSAIAATQASENAVARIDESREHIDKNLGSMKAEGRLGVQQLGDEMIALAGSLSRTSAQVIDIAPTLVRRTDELGSRLESGFASFRGQSEKDQNDLSDALQGMHKQILWLSVLCGLSFAGSVGLIVSRFVFHV